MLRGFVDSLSLSPRSAFLSTNISNHAEAPHNYFLASHNLPYSSSLPTQITPQAFLCLPPSTHHTIAPPVSLADLDRDRLRRGKAALISILKERKAAELRESLKGGTNIVKVKTISKKRSVNEMEDCGQDDSGKSFSPALQTAFWKCAKPRLRSGSHAI